MKSALSRPLYLTPVLLLACAIGASANVHLTFSSVNAGYVMGGVYTSPYKILVDGTPTLLICDDFLTDTPTTGGGWDAEETSLAELLAGTNPAGTPKFTPVSIKNYVAAAVLAAELMALPNYFSEQAGELSYAIWGIFDAPLLDANPTSGLGKLTPTQLSAALSFRNSALAVAGAAVAANDFSAIPQLTIYTPNPLNASQEFLKVSLVPMPEPSSIAFLAVDLLGLAGLVLCTRRRSTRIVK